MLGVKAGYMPPGNHLSHISGPIPEHTPTLTPYKDQVHLPLRERANKGIYCLFLLLAAAAEAPIKPCIKNNVTTSHQLEWLLLKKKITDNKYW